MSKKMEEVKEAGVRVLAEDFLADAKLSGKAVHELLSVHAISPWGAEVKVEAPAPPVAASKSGAMAAKSLGRVKEEEGEARPSSASKLSGVLRFVVSCFLKTAASCFVYRWQ